MTDVTQDTAPKAAAPVKKKKAKKVVPHGQVHIFSSFNNTIITITDDKGNTLHSTSAGASGFRGSKKGTPYAAQMAAQRAISDAVTAFGIKKVDVFVKGIGHGRESAIRTLATANVEVETMTDLTGAPHGGVRPKGARRV